MDDSISLQDSDSTDFSGFDSEDLKSPLRTKKSKKAVDGTKNAVNSKKSSTKKNDKPPSKLK